MARIRSIHPGLFTDDAIMQASLAARWLLIGIWSECDDQGAFQWKPATLKARIIPNDNVDVLELLEELTRLNFIKSYEHDGSKFGLVRNFRRFQKPKKPNSVHFIPAELRTYVGLTADGSEIEEDQQGGGSEPKPRSKPQSSEPVRNQFRTSGEKSRLMEDGGGSKKGIDNHSGSSNGRARGAPLPLDRLAKILKIDLTTLHRRPKFAEFPGVFRDWTAAGCDPEKDIWPTIEKLAKRSKDIGSPRFFEKAILEARDNRQALEPSETERWWKRVEGYYRDRFWSDQWGPKPGENGCMVPAEIIAELTPGTKSQPEANP